MGDTLVKIGDIEVAEDYEHQKKEWAVQRLGWLLFGLVLLAGLLGLLGLGPLSHAERRGEQLTVRYERIARHAAPAQLTYEVAPGVAGNDGTVQIWLDREFLAGVHVESVRPEPQSVTTSLNRMVYEFALTGADVPGVVVFTYRPVTKWSRPLRTGLENGPSYALTQFVLP